MGAVIFIVFLVLFSMALKKVISDTKKGRCIGCSHNCADCGSLHCQDSCNDKTNKTP